MELDRLGARAWPALEEERIGAWRLRFSRGVTGRANSVLPLGPDDGLALAARIERVEEAYRARGLPPKFQLTPSSWPPGLADALRARRYEEDAPTFVMTAPVGSWRDDRVAVAPALGDTWFSVYRAVDARGDADAARGILERIGLPTAFASCDGVAVGLGVLDGDWVGVYCMATLPHARRQGRARAVVAALLGWGRARGAGRSYLCTHSTNLTAQALYRSFGFEVAQDYRYFTAAG